MSHIAYYTPIFALSFNLNKKLNRLLTKEEVSLRTSMI